MPEVLTLPRKLAWGDLKAAAAINAAAFANDPLWVYILPDEHTRKRLLPQFFNFFIGVSIGAGEAYGVGDPLASIALWSVPGQAGGVGFSPTLLPSLAGFAASPVLLKLPQFTRIFARFEQMHKRYVHGEHLYLNNIGVDPAAQGRGLASQLIRPFLAEADARGLPTYTETMTPANVGLYAHYGFQVMEEHRIPNTDLMQWAFLRPAGS